MNVLELFAGIGGLSLGLERAGFRTIAFCEREPAPQFWLRNNFPGVPVFDDVRTLTGDAIRGLGPVDLIAGGFPCQPFSVAGKQKGTEDERHLWPHFARLIGEIRPRWVLAENVPGLRTIAADLVLEDLEGQGYTCWPGSRTAYTSAHRREALKAFGNAVVPQVVEIIGRAILHADREHGR